MSDGNETGVKEIIGGNRLIGQERLREQMWRIAAEDRISHAYLISGQPGSGKKPLALAFAEAINGIQNLGMPASDSKSHRRSWFFHPDIHVFIPMPGNAGRDELRARLELLAEDPYEIIDFSVRPSLTGQEDAKNRRAFYSVEYFNSEVRRAAYLRASEGRKNVVIITNVEKMRKEVSNSFLKMLEEPGKDVTFLLTTDNINSLLPTVISRCQHLPCQPLDSEQIYEGLRRFDGYPESDARFLSRISGGNYSFTRFYDTKTLQENREEIIRFLRMSYTVDVAGILDLSTQWQSNYNKEGHIAIINMIEMFLRDIALYSAGADESLITNSDKLDVISNFCTRLTDAKIDNMIETLQEAHSLLNQNVQPRLLFTVIANRYAAWMRGAGAPVPSGQAWKHMPAVSEP
ncbi:ATP-binding protein [Natronogracilivirga saccharolytica]|uniref:DNA polymerase III subunit delta' n=1 Tax=Natronogracilivirga saccharolytica TaxID=2812953 RepID=A0A8J7S8P0_9BACT|nr:DNA polymerase III subunit delta' C-terminal domain-containing protein [Natronogracilivirga saccharolytica]MBP3192353.1 hypothetical protein [Natronogracilivirga saccharolytica]